VARVQQHYEQASIERLAVMSNRYGRRAANFALVSMANFSANSIVGAALADTDRHVREIARQGIARLWQQTDDRLNQIELLKIIELNRQTRYAQAALNASELLEVAPAVAEVWNQRSLAHHRLKLYTDAIRDGRRTMEFNPYHFECLIRMGRCHEQLDDPISALDYFRQALTVHPDLAGVRAKVHYLQRSLSD
jgi:tetratricopeptide (TPR) repeat protein